MSAFVRKDHKRLGVFFALAASFSFSLSLIFSLPPSLTLSFHLQISVSTQHRVRRRAEEMAVAETQLYAKVSNKHRSKSTSSLLESLLAKGFPAHIA